MEGTIKSAVWNISRLNRPYISLEIEFSKPEAFYGQTLTKVFGRAGWPWSLKELGRYTDLDLLTLEPIENKTILELIDKVILIELIPIRIHYLNTVFPRVQLIAPPEIKLKDLIRKLERLPDKDTLEENFNDIWEHA